MRGRGVRGVVAAVITGGALYVFLTLSLHGNELLTLAGSAFLGVCVLAVVATQGDENQLAADAAWRDAAPDLPPVSDRLALDRTLARSAASRPAAARRVDVGQAPPEEPPVLDGTDPRLPHAVADDGGRPPARVGELGR